MIKNLFKYCIIFGIIFVIQLKGQAPIGEFHDYFLLKNKDTVKMSKTYGDWWFGAKGGLNTLFYFGNLKLWASPNEKDNPFNVLLNYSGGSGYGSFLGLTAEYLPINEYWGFNFDLNLLDRRKGASKTDIIDSNNRYFEFESQFDYINLSTNIRYNYKDLGFHIFGGLECDFNFDLNPKIRQVFNNPERIEDFRNYNELETPIRFGTHIGAGWDIFMADIKGKTSIRFTPFVSLHLGTKLLNENSSNWNSLFFRVGLAVKFGKDRVKYDTLPFDPTANPPLEMIASTQKSIGIEINRSVPKSLDLIASLEMPKPETSISTEIKTKSAEKPPVEGEIGTKVMKKDTLLADNKIGLEPEPKEKIITNKEKKFLYPGSVHTTLTKEMKNYLDDLADFLKKNPGWEVRVIGHSDNTGTLEQNTQRSEVRANSVRKYLLDKGISYGRILVSWKGSLSPVKTNDTEEGRRANRRVEITVVGNGKR